MAEYEACLKQAHSVQEGVVEGLRGDHPDIVAAHKQAAAEMQIELAHLYASQQKPNEASFDSCLAVLQCACLHVYY